MVTKTAARALVIYNEGENFSVGANLGLALFAANIALWPAIEELVGEGQQVYKALKYAPFPVVGAPSGMALGGGCEILLHCDAVQAHAETYMGLVEAGVGIMPAGAAARRCCARWRQSPSAPQAARCRRSPRRSRRSPAPRWRSRRPRRTRSAISAPDRRHHHEPRPPAGRRQGAGAGAGRGLPAAGSRPRSACPARPARAALELAVDGFAPPGKATPHDARSPARWPRC